VNAERYRAVQRHMSKRKADELLQSLGVVFATASGVVSLVQQHSRSRSDVDYRRAFQRATV